MIKILILILLITVYSCEKIEYSEKDKISNEITCKACKRLRDEMHLMPVGFGGRITNQVEKLHLSLEYRHPIEIDDGRQMILQAAKVFLFEINSNTAIRPHLDVYPFQYKNIEIVLFLTKEDGSDLEQGKLVVVALRDGRLQYRLQGSDKFTYEKTLEETIETALMSLQKPIL